jgi:hypothetical protein
MSMKKLILSLVACACALPVFATSGDCDKSKDECPAKKSCGDKGKDGKGGCTKDKKEKDGKKETA